jgi:NAD-dependent SIR2 family protein deacetylase
MEDLSLKEGLEFTYEDLVNGLKEGKFKNILVMSGAGISVSAGIPDFRSPKTGVYDNLAEYNLPTPNSIFEINYFKEKPQAYYKFCQTFNLEGYNPTPTHFFLKLLQDKGHLWKNIS